MTTIPIRLIEHCFIVRRTFFVSIVLTQIAITIGTKLNQITQIDHQIHFRNMQLFFEFQYFFHNLHVDFYVIVVVLTFQNVFHFLRLRYFKRGFLPANNTHFVSLPT